MQGLEEVLIVLVFIGIMVVQFITKRRERRVPKPPAPPMPPGLPVPTVPPERRAPTLEEALAGLDQAIPKVWPPRARVDAPTREPPPAVAIALPPPPRRFSRASLFADRRAVQDAIVIATILGPCRALEPPGSEASAATPQGRGGSAPPPRGSR
jgi:hypothetical protein